MTKARLITCVLGCLTVALVCSAQPVLAKWNYCYSEPGIGQTYPEMPPRTFGFANAVLPFAFKRMCGLNTGTETDHLRRIVTEFLECTPESDFAVQVEGMLKAHETALFLTYFGHPQEPLSGEAWAEVCRAALPASAANLAFGDTWYFDSDSPVQDRADLQSLLDALNRYSQALETTQ